MSSGKALRELIAQEGMAVAPGCYDGLTAKLIRQAGFNCIYMSGGSTSSAHGYPDYGLLTMSEMVENASRVADAVDVPVISDADNGYGNELKGQAGSIAAILPDESELSIIKIPLSVKE